MSLTKLSLAGKNSIILGQGEFGQWHPAWGRENRKPFFYSVCPIHGRRIGSLKGHVFLKLLLELLPFSPLYLDCNTDKTVACHSHGRKSGRGHEGSYYGCDSKVKGIEGGGNSNDSYRYTFSNWCYPNSYFLLPTSCFLLPISCSGSNSSMYFSHVPSPIHVPVSFNSSCYSPRPCFLFFLLNLFHLHPSSFILFCSCSPNYLKLCPCSWFLGSILWYSVALYLFRPCS
jgi:hypothetical protein